MPACGLAAGQGVAGQVDASLRHAETYYLLSVTEQGDVPASQAGLRELEHAEEVLKQGTLPAEEAERLGRQIKALKNDLQDQIEMSRWTLEGVFPLSGFLTSSLFAGSGPTAVYRLTDDPAITATRKAAADLLTRATGLEKKQAQLPVVFTCVPSRELLPGTAAQAEDSGPDRLRARTLEHAVRQVFRRSPQFQVQTHAAVEEALAPAGKETPQQAGDDFLAGHITAAVQKRLLETFGPRLLAVVIRQADAVADVCCYRTEGRFLEAGKPPQEAFSTSGFGRDRRGRLAWILWANAALLAVAYAAYVLIAHTHRAMTGGSSRIALLLLPLVAFAVGRTLPYVVSSLLGSVRPPPGTPALASLWFACLAGLGFLGAPLLAYWLASPWFAELWPSLSPGNRGGALFVAMGAGIAAYLAGPVLLCSEQHPAIDVMLMGTSVMVLAYLLGRTLDRSDPLPMSLAFVLLILTMPAGAALLHADTTWLGLAAAAIVATGAAVVSGSALVRKRRSQALRSDFNPSLAGQARIGGVPADVQEFIRRAENPDYQRFPSFDRAWERMSGVLEGHCCRLGLFGPRGAGKTATVQAIIAGLAQEWEKRGSRPALLCGSCPQAVGEPISYAPFREVLAQHFEVNLLAPPGPKMRQIGQALGGLFGSVIPFARILFPHVAGTGDAAAKPDEINASIVWMLRRLAKTRPVLLFLDDVQWLDEASAALVKHLLEEFPAGSDTPLAVILVANRKSCLAALGFDVSRDGIELAYPPVAQQAEILVRGAGLQAAVADDILGARAPPGKPTGACSGRYRWRRSSPARAPWRAPRKGSPGPMALGRQTSPFRPTCKQRSRSNGTTHRNITRSWRVRPADVTAASSASARSPTPWAGRDSTCCWCWMRLNGRRAWSTTSGTAMTCTPSIRPSCWRQSVASSTLRATARARPTSPRSSASTTPGWPSLWKEP